ncbi:MAG: DUF3656 domain-containing protein [Acutalibacteraceae bacterium]
MGKIEILAPAGSMESITPAVRCGADAVYIGAKKLSARASAGNFDAEEMKQAVAYCHAAGVKVYMACNILLHDYELKEALELIEYALSVGVDAFIVQDVGLASLIRKAAPQARLHGSTQMSVHTPKGVRLLHEMGFKRAVLSRELSFEEIRAIAKDSPIELEVFVHGALCMSVSGQCYFSAMLGSRSGNRGACAQTCRLPFKAAGGTGHDLSLKDISLISHLQELESIGVTSAKIEGRMKRPEYVAAAVTACRQQRDNGAVSEEIERSLRAVFSRSGFTDGYFTGRRGVEMFGIREKENVTAATNKVFAELRGLYKDESKRVPIECLFDIREGQPSKLICSDYEGHKAEIEGTVPETARNVPLTEEKCKNAFSKTGGTVFNAAVIDGTVGEGLSLSAADMNVMRREALERLYSQRSAVTTVPFTMPVLPVTDTRQGIVPKKYRVRLTDCVVPEEFSDCDLIYVPYNRPLQEYEKLLERGLPLGIEIPRGMFGLERQIATRLAEIRDKLGIYDVLASNVGAVQMAKELNMDIHGGFGLNLMNTAAIDWAERMGIMDCEVSFELTLEQISRLGGRLPIGLIAYGHLPLMLTRNCPAQNDGKGCKNCMVTKKTPYLRDRKKIDFPMQCYGACTEILNAVPLILSDRKNEIKGVDFTVFRFSVENLVEKVKNSPVFNKNNTEKKAFTRGLYYRGVE